MFKKIKLENIFWAWKFFQNSIDETILIRPQGLEKNPKIINKWSKSILESSVVQIYQLMQILSQGPDFLC